MSNVDKSDRQPLVGLRRYTVRIVDHEPGWVGLAAEVCREIAGVCGELVVDVQHVGSTAVAGLPAKPILDIAAAVWSVEAMAMLIDRLEPLNYIYRGDGGGEGGHLFVRESEPEVRTVHLHVVDRDDAQWANYLLFRDLLRGDAEIREQYAGLKTRLAATFANDRRSYTSAKHEFIRRLLETHDPDLNRSTRT